MSLESFRLAAIADNKLASMVSTLHAIGDKGATDVKVLWDTGAGVSLILRSIAEKLATIVKAHKPLVLTLGDGGKMPVTDQALITLDAGGDIITDNFYVLDSCVEEVILGESTMRKFALKIDMERNVIYSALRTDKIQEDKVMWKKFLAVFGISVADEVTEEKAVELLKAKLASTNHEHDHGIKPIASPKILAVLELKETATEDEVRGAILALKSPGNVVAAADHEKVQQELHEHKIIAAVAQARADGKISPAEEPTWLKDLKEGAETLATFATFVARRGKIVPIDVKLATKKDETAAAVQIDEIQAAVNKQMGVTPERFAKYNPRAS
jgi:hypothetical protein